MRPLGGWVESTSIEKWKGVSWSWHRGAGWGNRKDQRGHLQVREKGTLKLRGQALRCLSEIPLAASPGEGAGRQAASSLSVSVHGTSPNRAVPVFPEHLPQGTTLRASLRVLSSKFS